MEDCVGLLGITMGETIAKVVMMVCDLRGELDLLFIGGDGLVAAAHLEKSGSEKGMNILIILIQE